MSSKCVLVISVFILLALAGTGNGQTSTNGIIDNSRDIDWSHVGVTGGIPTQVSTDCSREVTQ